MLGDWPGGCGFRRAHELQKSPQNRSNLQPQSKLHSSTLPDFHLYQGKRVARAKAKRASNKGSGYNRLPMAKQLAQKNPRVQNKKNAPRRRSLKKTPTGIQGLDEITHGGLPSGRTTLICGGAGSG